MTTQAPTVGNDPTNPAWTGRGKLSQLVAELERQKASRLDVILDARTIRVSEADRTDATKGLRLVPEIGQAMEFLPKEGVNISTNALVQMGERVTPNIPTKFIKELAAQRAAVCADLVTNLLVLTAGRNLVRCLDGRVRAFLSHKYRVLDNYDLAFAAMETAQSVGAEILECSLTDTNMRIKIIERSTWEELDAFSAAHAKGAHSFYWPGAAANQKYARNIGTAPLGEGMLRPEENAPPERIHPIVTISNSETGNGGLGVKLGIFGGYCLNTATLETVVARVHLGQAMEVGMLSPEAIAADSKAIMLKARDGIRAGFNPDLFKKLIARCKAAHAQPIEAPTQAVANLVSNTDMSEGEREALLAHFLRDYKPTRYGLAQAVARLAQDNADGDRAVELEELAGQVIDKPGLVLA